MTERDQRPLVVDLDRSLLATDLLHESVVALLRSNPLRVFQLPFWLAKGVLHLKRQVAQRVEIDAAGLPFNESVLAFVTDEHERGRRLVLATASDALLAEKVAGRLGIFSLVIANNGTTNLKGEKKLAEIRSALGPDAEFEYLGDSRSDLPIFREASVSHLVNPSAGLLDAASKTARVGRVFRRDGPKLLPAVAKTVRVHQWVKNLLIFLPAILAHDLSSQVMMTLLAAFLAFSLVASATYIANDLLDLEADRKHPVNRKRPIASGRFGLPTAIMMMAVCLAAGLLLAVTIPAPFLGIVALYAVLSLAYSGYLKRLLVIDVLALASFYSMRILAGGVAAGVPISGWLLSFSIFFFLGLALLKRYVELVMSRSDGKPATARAYFGDDVTFVGTFGVVSGMLAILVFVLYLNSGDVVVLYSRPDLLWWVNLPLIYWTMRMWLNASRGLIHSDPIISALKDPVSYVCAGAVAALLLLAIG